jgi:GntR family transcriptional regulator/MocR family aminotransferase
MTTTFSYPVWNLLHFDRSSHEPLQEQLFEQLCTAIVQGHIGRGTRLPPSRLLAEELDVSRNTVVGAYERLAAEGYLTQRVGAGTFVARTLPEDHQVRGTKNPQAPSPSRPLSQRGQSILDMDLPWGRIQEFDLSPGTPALDEFPFDAFAQLAGRLWRSHPFVDLGYGDPGGLRLLREQIALYLGEARGLACEPDQVIVVSHTLQALTLVSHVLLDPGDTALIEDPSYTAEAAALAASGVRSLSIPIDADGLDIGAATNDERRSRLAVVAPVGQFGSTMSPDRRTHLLQWARETGSWIFEDDFNSDLRWAGQPMAPLASGEGGNHVIYCNSFNRILAPGLRIGFLVIPPDLIDAFTAAQQALSFHVSLPIQHLLSEFMARGHLAAHMRRMRAIYSERAITLSQSLREECGDSFTVPDVTAGLYLLAEGNDDFDDVAISNAALRHRLDVPPLSRYCLSGKRRRGLILGFASTPTVRIPRCVRALARIIAEMGRSPA